MFYINELLVVLITFVTQFIIWFYIRDINVTGYNKLIFLTYT